MNEAPFTIGTLDHLVLRVRDVDRMVTFYRDVLGCTLERTLEEYGLYQLRAGGALVDLVTLDGPIGRGGGAGPGEEGRNMDHFCLRIDPFDADAIASWLDSAGVVHEAPATRYGADGYGQSIYLRDPEDNVVELKGPPGEG
ncbi:MAG: VOC family protein [Pseudomonadales bacterium]|jgi:catechol 2,3-dioxygenase-like lactoylglutathione lyase family enzyme|nr:VOC family protein [Pseudomonadales bacterium]